MVPEAYQRNTDMRAILEGFAIGKKQKNTRTVAETLNLQSVYTVFTI